MPIIKPNPNKQVEGKPLQIFDPVRKAFLPVEGREVPNSEYWTRRIADGSVIKINTIEEKNEDTKPKDEKSSTKRKVPGKAPTDNPNDKKED